MVNECRVGSTASHSEVSMRGKAGKGRGKAGKGRERERDGKN